MTKMGNQTNSMADKPMYPFVPQAGSDMPIFVDNPGSGVIKEQEKEKIFSILNKPRTSSETGDHGSDVILQSDEPLEILDLPTRLKNALLNADIMTVGQFYGLNGNNFLKFRNIGPKNQKFLIEYRKAMKVEGILPSKEAPVMSAPVSIHDDRSDSEMWELLLKHVKNTRESDIIKRRYGLINGDRETLEEIGNDYGVTRERIRQIEKKALGKLRTYGNLHIKKLVSDVRTAIWLNGGLVTEEEADRFMVDLLGITGYDGSSILDLFSDLNLIQRYTLKDFLFYCPLYRRQISLENFSEKILSVLKKNPQGISVSEIARAVPEIKDVKKTEIIGLVEKYCSLDARIEKATPLTYRLFRRGKLKYYESLITKVLETEGTPLHFTEISYKTNKLLKEAGHKLDERRIYAIVLTSGKFAHTGKRGTYGLTEWGIRKEMMPDLIEECIRKAGFPLRVDQIYYFVSKYKDTRRINISAVLNSNRRFLRNSDGSFSVRGS